MRRSWRATTTLDATRIGGSNYAQAEVREVMAAIRGATSTAALTQAELAFSTGVPGRTVRSILSDCDGNGFVVSKTPQGMYVCRYADEAEVYTRYLDRHWRSERDRVVRRKDFQRSMPRRQLNLFEGDYDFDDEDDV